MRDRHAALESLLNAVEGAAAIHAQETAEGAVRARSRESASPTGMSLDNDRQQRRKSPLRCAGTESESQSTCRALGKFESGIVISPFTADAWEIPDDAAPHLPLPGLNTFSPPGDWVRHELVQPDLNGLALLLKEQRRVEEATRQQAQQLATVQMQLAAMRQQSKGPCTSPRHSVVHLEGFRAPESARMPPLTVEANNLLRTAARQVEQYPRPDAEAARPPPQMSPSPLAHLEPSIADFLSNYKQLVSEMDQSKEVQPVPPPKRFRSESKGAAWASL
jgi:hypothetical protein